MLHQSLFQARDHEVDDLDDLVLRELVEHDDVVDAVEELRSEVLLELLLHLGLHALVGRVTLVLRGEAQGLTLGHVAATEVGRHDDDGVLEVDHATLSIGEPALFEHLQQRVEDVGVGLLDLVKKHDRERTATHLLSELPALFISDVAGR